MPTPATASRRSALASLVLLAASSCATRLPDESPPLADMVEPIELFAEPDDEALRRQLPAGGFTGCYVGESRETLEAMFEEAPGVTVERLVENSPAQIAGLVAGDLLVEAKIGDGPPRPLRHASQWRAVEIEAAPGSKLSVVFDRANRRGRAVIDVVPRVGPPERAEARRLREEQRVGVVLRTATEVEARAAGLGPGGGAVIVGLSSRSPWRAAGLRFGDLIIGVDGHRVAAPQVVLERIGAAGERMRIDYVRDGKPAQVEAPLSSRAHECREFFLPPLIDYESRRGKSDCSLLLGLFRYEKTVAAWRLRLFWLIRIGGGDADALLEAKS